MQQLRLFLEKYQDVPYKVITFLTGQINYGGRVTDDWDRRTLMTLIKSYITPAVLEDGYKFSPLDEYQSIPAGDYKNYVEYLESLPLIAPPVLFGLHDNAELTYNQSELTIMNETIISMQPKGSSGSGRDQIIEKLASDILHKIPQRFDIQDVESKYPTVFEESMNTVLVQEVLRYNKLLDVVTTSLRDLLKAIKGIVVMSNELEEMGNSMFNNQIPEMWDAVSYPSLMPLGAWVTDLIARCQFIDDWYRNGTPNVFWISGFFFPQAFLTGTLQNYARKHGVAIDRVSFGFEIMDIPLHEIESKPEEGCYVRGMYLEGARWDSVRKTLTESNPKELYTTLPVVWLRPQTDRVQPTGVYNCPVYKTLQRAGTLSTTGHSTNYVFCLEIPTIDHDEDFWIARGVASFLALRF